MKHLTLILCLVCAIKHTKLTELDEFPSNFLFGVASSAYQIEGAWNVNGKGENIWDQFTHTHPENILDRSNGDIACDSYNKLKEDIALLKELGVDFYRFSISWSRLLPYGYSNYVNPDGLRYYNDLINELVANGIKPMVTLYHWDLPVPLSNIGGWANPLLSDIFAEYARVAFANFGNRVPYWLTINTDCRGYRNDVVPPGLDEAGVANYMCGYVTLLAHAKAYRIYEKHFKESQKGEVGIVSMDVVWFEAIGHNPKDQYAAERARQFTSGWMSNPLIGTGDYPKIMEERIAFRSYKEGFLRSRLPSLSIEDKKLIKGACDFIGMNIYTSNYVSDVPEDPFVFPDYYKDMRAKFSVDPTWPNSSAEWLKVVPTSARKILNWFKKEYNNPKIIITESGFSDNGELIDHGRVNFYRAYLNEILKAIREDGVNVVAFAAWSLTDNFEWNEGYTQKFGLHYVDFNHPNRTRAKKLSANLYKRWVKRKRLD